MSTRRRGLRKAGSCRRRRWAYAIVSAITTVALAGCATGELQQGTPDVTESGPVPTTSTGEPSTSPSPAGTSTAAVTTTRVLRERVQFPSTFEPSTAPPLPRAFFESSSPGARAFK